MSVFLICGVQFKFTGAACIRHNAALLMLPGRKKSVEVLSMKEIQSRTGIIWHFFNGYFLCSSCSCPTCFDKPKSLLLELELACLYIPGDGDVFGLYINQN